MIIAPSFTSDYLMKAQKLKALSNEDTDVGLITAKILNMLLKIGKINKSLLFSLIYLTSRH